MFSVDDVTFMRKTLELARKGRHSVSPNPRVGCVIVRPPSSSNQNPVILGSGYHVRKGKPHAERIALANCSDNPRGATLYVNLEPCCHYGATPPCTDAIIEAGIQRVVVATVDPFQEVQGKGIRILREHGIHVDVGLLEEEARYENRFFFHFHQCRLPWVLLKAAMSLDGKLSTHSRRSKWITGETAREHAHQLRGEMDAVLVGVGTVIHDDPILTARCPDEEVNQPVRVVLDPMLQMSPKSRLVNTLDTAPVWIFCAPESPEHYRKQFEDHGVRITVVDRDHGKLDLYRILRELAAKSILSVMVEGGPTIHTSFLEHSLVNEVAVYIAPILIGGVNAPTFYMGQGADTIEDACRIKRVESIQLKEDTLIRGILRWQL